MKIKILLTIFILALAMTGCTSGEPPAEESELAKIGDTVITGQQLREYMILFAYEQGTSVEATTDETTYSYVKKAVLENMISNEIMRQYLERRNFEIMSEEKESLLQNYKEQLQSSDEIAGYLKEGVISEAGIQYAFIAPYYSTFFYDAVAEEVDLSEGIRRAYYAQHQEDMHRSMVTASHILVLDEALAWKIRDELEKGEEFGELAKAYSEDSATKDIDGELGSFGKNETIPEFEKAVFSMEPGEISGPVLSSYGYHIIKLKDKYEELLPFETVDVYIQELLVKEACNEKLEELSEKTVEYLSGCGING